MKDNDYICITKAMEPECKLKTMNLGTETGSIVNHMYSTMTGETLDVNKGATILGWTDRTPCFVNSVSKDGKTVEIEYAKAVRIDTNGMSEVQDYRYERDEHPYKLNLKFRYGSWYIDNGKNAPYERYSKINIKFGFMQKYYDFSF